MPHIHNDDNQHDFTASAYIVLLGESDPRLCLHKHRLLNQWLQFGGHVELHENPWQAVAHEIKEESGYELSQLSLLQPKVRMRKLSDAILHPQPFAILTHQFADTAHYHIDLAYAFVTTSKPEGVAHDGESQEFKAMTLAEIKALKKGEIPENVRENAIFMLSEVLLQWEQVGPQEFTL